MSKASGWWPSLTRYAQQEDRTRYPRSVAPYQDTVDQLRDEAKANGITGIWEMMKEEVVAALAARSGRPSGEWNSAIAGDGPTLRTEWRKPRAGRPRSSWAPARGRIAPARLWCGETAVIRQWAERRAAQPATVEGTEHGGQLSAFDLAGYGRSAAEDEPRRVIQHLRCPQTPSPYLEHRVTNERRSSQLENRDRKDA